MTGSLPCSPRFGRLALRRLAITLVVAALVATAGCSGVLPGSDAGEGSDPIEYVPQGQDIVVRVDMAILQDQTTRDLAAALEDEQVEEDNPQQALEEFRQETGLDPSALHEVLVFGQSADYSMPGSSSPSGDYGAVLQSDWGEEELVAAIERNQSADLQVTSYQGRDVLYEPVGGSGDEEPVYLGVLGEGTYVVGTEAAVTGSLDVEYGDASAVSGTLRDAYDDAPDGLVTFAMAVPQDQLGGGTTGGMGSSAAQDIEAVNGVYTTEGDRVRVETRLLTSSEQSATELQQMIQGLVTFYGQGDPQASQLAQRIEVQQDGTAVRVTFEASVDEIAQLSESS